MPPLEINPKLKENQENIKIGLLILAGLLILVLFYNLWTICLF